MPDSSALILAQSVVAFSALSPPPAAHRLAARPARSRPRSGTICRASDRTKPGVEHEPTVAVAPGIAGLLILFDVPFGTPSCFSRAPSMIPPCPPPMMRQEGSAPLPKAASSAGPALRTGCAIAVGAVADAQRAADAGSLLMTIERLQRRKYGAALATFKGEDAGAAPCPGGKAEPRLDGSANPFRKRW